jgi:hypothetical protein
LGLIAAARAKFPTVRVEYCNAVDAVRKCLKLPVERPIDFRLKLSGNRLEVAADKETWGPQPFLCFKTLDGRYLHDNLDERGPNRWHYTFDQETVPLRAVETVGVASNDAFGNASICLLSVASGKTEKTVRNGDRKDG